jgi:hypothetical protein
MCPGGDVPFDGPDSKLKRPSEVGGRQVVASLAVDSTSIRELALQRAADLQIFHAARAAGAVVLTKDADFAALSKQLGAPPQIVLVTAAIRLMPTFGRCSLRRSRRFA